VKLPEVSVLDAAFVLSVAGIAALTGNAIGAGLSMLVAAGYFVTGRRVHNERHAPDAFRLSGIVDGRTWTPEQHQLIRLRASEPCASATRLYGQRWGRGSWRSQVRECSGFPWILRLSSEMAALPLMQEIGNLVQDQKDSEPEDGEVLRAVDAHLLPLLLSGLRSRVELAHRVTDGITGNEVSWHLVSAVQTRRVHEGAFAPRQDVRGRSRRQFPLQSGYLLLQADDLLREVCMVARHRVEMIGQSSDLGLQLPDTRLQLANQRLLGVVTRVLGRLTRSVSAHVFGAVLRHPYASFRVRPYTLTAVM